MDLPVSMVKLVFQTPCTVRTGQSAARCIRTEAEVQLELRY